MRVPWGDWLERHVESETVYGDPLLMDPMGYDFRPKPESPLAGRADELPLRCIPEAEIEAARRYFAWTGADG
jgi:hypothetical protein